MSCNRNETSCSRTAGLKAGIGPLTGRAAGATGTLLAAANDATGRRIAPVSNRVLGLINRPTTLTAGMAPYLLTAAVAGSTALRLQLAVRGPSQGYRPVVAAAIGLREPHEMIRQAGAMARTTAQVRRFILPAKIATDSLAGAVVSLSEKPDEKRHLAQTKASLLGRRTQVVEFSQSRLTEHLNRQDRLVGRTQVISSRGEVVRLAGRNRPASGPAWHLGETTLKTSAGVQTITHLQSLALPSTSHYFERRLSAEETASLITGQVKSHQLPGYVGSIGAIEKLAPGWAQTKRALTLIRLHWPPAAAEPTWSPVAGRQAAADQPVRHRSLPTKPAPAPIEEAKL